MRWLIIVLAGILWIVIGIFGLVATKNTTLAISNLLKNSKRQNLGIISLVFGVLLLISASTTKAPWFVLALGILASLKGVTIVLMPEKKFTAVIDWWLAAPDIVYKGWATLSLILGVAMFYII